MPKVKRFLPSTILGMYVKRYVPSYLLTLFVGKPHLTTSGLTRCYLTPDVSERAPP